MMIIIDIIEQSCKMSSFTPIDIWAKNFPPNFRHFLAIFSYFSHFLLLSKILPQVYKICVEIYLPYPWHFAILSLNHQLFKNIALVGSFKHFVCVIAHDEEKKLEL